MLQHEEEVRHLWQDQEGQLGSVDAVEQAGSSSAE